MSRTRLAIVGLGKIARDQHVPSLMASPAFELVAVASPHSRLPGVPNYADLAALLKAVPDLPAVALCTTPQVRFETARMALEQGCHVLLEKPPGMTTSEVQVLEDLARSREVALYASWHSRYANGVEPARAWLQGRQVRRVEVVWKEDVRVWHPGQRWIWKAGGLGVFDPGINALSILSRILPGDLLLHSAELFFPGNCETPIAAQLQLTSTAGAAVHMALDFLHTGSAHWNIDRSGSSTAAASCSWMAGRWRLPGRANMRGCTSTSRGWCASGAATWISRPSAWWPTPSCAAGAWKWRRSTSNRRQEGSRAVDLVTSADSRFRC